MKITNYVLRVIATQVRKVKRQLQRVVSGFWVLCGLMVCIQQTYLNLDASLK